MDVVHVLNKAHCSLRTGGVLLETHPEPENPSVEVRLARGRNVPIDFRVHVNPQTYTQKPEGPTLREVSDLIHQLGL